MRHTLPSQLQLGELSVSAIMFDKPVHKGVEIAILVSAKALSQQWFEGFLFYRRNLPLLNWAAARTITGVNVNPSTPLLIPLGSLLRGFFYAPNSSAPGRVETIAAHHSNVRFPMVKPCPAPAQDCCRLPEKGKESRL